MCFAIHYYHYYYYYYYEIVYAYSMLKEVKQDTKRQWKNVLNLFSDTL